MSFVDLYEVGITFLIQGDVLAEVAELQNAMVALQEGIDRVNAALSKTADFIGTASGAAGSLAASFDAAAAAAGRVADASAKMSIPAGGGGDTGGGGDGAPSGPPPIIPPTDDDNQPQQRRQAPEGANPWDYIIAGAVGLDASKTLLTHSYTDAADVQHQGVVMTGMSDKTTPEDIANAEAAAKAMQQKFPGMSQPDAMILIRDAYMQTRGAGGMPEAIQVAQQLATAAYDLHESGDDSDASDLINALKAGDLRGVLNTKNPDGTINYKPLADFINDVTRVSVSEGGRVTPQDAMTVIAQGGAGAMKMNQDAVDTALVMVANGLSAAQVGTGINAIDTQFLGGKMSQGAAQNLHRAGLLPDWMFDPETGKILDHAVNPDTGKETPIKNGIGNVLIPSGQLKGQDELEQNPFKWVQDVLWPAIQAQYPNDPTAQQAALYGDVSRIPGARLISAYVNTDPTIQRQLGNLENVPSATQLATNAANDPTNIATGVVTAAEGLFKALGSASMPTTTAQLKDLTAALNGLADWATTHPNASSAVIVGAEGGAALSAGAIIAGATKLIMAGINKTFGLGESAAATGAGEAAAGAEGAAAGAGVTAGGLVAGAASGVGLGVALMELAHKLQDALNRRGLDARILSGEDFPDGPSGKAGDPLHVVLSGGGAVPVQVTNPGDIARGTSGYLEREFGMKPTGQTGPNSYLSPYLPGADAPGAYHP